jgi:hypothetical protein
MKKIFTALVIALAILAVAGVASASSPKSMDFAANLSGGQEVPARDTNATGGAVFHLTPDGSRLKYVLKVENLDNPFASHIHCGFPGENGPIGVTLFIGSPGSGEVNGLLAKGTITAPDPGNACAWVTLSDVVDAINNGFAYVNVHTSDGVDPANTGPGDFPGGEIRGQVH